jgi:transposase-like protein
MATSEKRTTAERHFVYATKTLQRPERARTEQEEENRTIGEKTARLRSLRLARDAADKEAAQGQAKKAANPKRANPVPKPNHRTRDD